MKRKRYNYEFKTEAVQLAESDDASVAQAARDLGVRYEARREIFEFVEIFYNRQRIHSYLDNVSPAKFEASARKDA